MAYLIWVVRIALFILLFGLAARNTDIVHVKGYLGYEWQAPLSVVLLVSTTLGVLLGIIGALRTMMYVRKMTPARLIQNAGTTNDTHDPFEESQGVNVTRAPISYSKAGQSLADEEGA